MNSKFLLPTLGALIALLSACAPLVPYPYDDPYARGRDQPGGPVGSAEQQAREEARRQAERREQEARPEPPKRETVKKPDTGNKPGYPRAIPIPGKDGYVFNPYTNNPVDVRGIPSGTLVKDPQDPEGSKNFFRVP